MNYLIRDLPEDIFRKFKSICASEGKTMREVIIWLIHQLVSNNIKIPKNIKS